MTATLRIPVQESLLEILKGLGSLEIVTASALRRYALDRCLQRIEQAERQIAFYERTLRIRLQHVQPTYLYRSGISGSH